MWLLSSDRVARSAATSACEGSSRQPIPRGIAAERAQLLDQRGADLLPNDAIEASGVLAQLLERRRSERLLGFRRLHQEADFHGEVFHGNAPHQGSGSKPSCGWSFARTRPAARLVEC